MICLSSLNSARLVTPVTRVRGSVRPSLDSTRLDLPAFCDVHKFSQHQAASLSHATRLSFVASPSASPPSRGRPEPSADVSGQERARVAVAIRWRARALARRRGRVTSGGDEPFDTGLGPGKHSIRGGELDSSTGTRVEEVAP